MYVAVFKLLITIIVISVQQSPELQKVLDSLIQGKEEDNDASQVKVDLLEVILEERKKSIILFILLRYFYYIFFDFY